MDAAGMLAIFAKGMGLRLDGLGSNQGVDVFVESGKKKN